MSEKPFEEWNYRLVPSSYGEFRGKKRYYRVSSGASQWREADPGSIHKTCVVFIQFGITENYDEAKRKREIVFDYPAHILNEDMVKVSQAMKEVMK